MIKGWIGNRKVYIVLILIIVGMLAAGCHDKKDSNKLHLPVLKDNGDIVAIQMRETGGEDGRDEEWSLYYEDNRYMFCYKNNRDKFPVEEKYAITESEYREMVEIDFSEYIGKKDDNEVSIGEVIYDAVYFDTVIQYENGVTVSTKENIVPLQHQFYELLAKYRH